MEKGRLTQNGVHLQEHEYATIKLFLDKGFDIEHFTVTFAFLAIPLME